MTQTMGTRRSIPVPNAGVWPGLLSAPHNAPRAAIAKVLVRAAVTKLPIRVMFPDGTWWGGGTAYSPQMVLHRPAHFFNRLGVDIKIGFGEAYMVGDWTTGPDTDLADLLLAFAERLQSLIPAPLQRLRGLVESMQPDDEDNRIGQAERNIARHYDLSNELFENFLDPGMLYSSALFEPGDDLQAAQVRKVESVLDYARVGADSDVLEIGTGWGQLAIQAAQRGAQVTSVTLSREQRDLALQRISAAGVADRVDVQLRDYREVGGQYDAIVSVEMIEAVGERYWPEYFQTVDRLLRPDGRFGLQSILMDHRAMMATRKSYTWIHKYVFPGGIIPSAYAIEQTLQGHTSLQILERRDFGRHYARTLRLWRERFDERWEQVRAAGFDETFKRMWDFYLAYCEAGFASRYLSVAQFSIGRDAI
ncbi:methyltransferase domain-containing protein [Epidermidibacterium keratini]|uniref:Methyltransferase domain-containing protein n=1 Tax=Epidermidibacterium keratini TaxID=1891644 RepID=A0A7L4YN69_9ACTN|nr:cyclopropane-fatty-acyl-phospholipid synthase family protein [Epidermidibacterium keratini]QHC00600.1 methyltransferase domain-containing protein [Epidermidibacterium keratini]